MAKLKNSISHLIENPNDINSDFGFFDFDSDDFIIIDGEEISLESTNEEIINIQEKKQDKKEK